MTKAALLLPLQPQKDKVLWLSPSTGHRSHTHPHFAEARHPTAVLTTLLCQNIHPFNTHWISFSERLLLSFYTGDIIYSQFIHLSSHLACKEQRISAKQESRTAHAIAQQLKSHDRKPLQGSQSWVMVQWITGNLSRSERLQQRDAAARKSLPAPSIISPLCSCFPILKGLATLVVLCQQGKYRKKTTFGARNALHYSILDKKSK